MNNITINLKKSEHKLNLLFLGLFMLYSIFNSNSVTFGRAIISPVMYACFIFAILILIYKLINFKSHFKMPQTLLLFSMLASISISTIANYKYNFKSNFIFCIYWVIYFLIVFSTKKYKSIDSCKKDIKFISVIFLSYTTIAVVASLLLFVFDYSFIRIMPDGGEYNIGFVWGRLWGVFINPNNGAISSAISILILIYGFITYKRLWIKILSVISIVLHLLYMVLSDSRSGAVVLAVAIGTLILFTFSKKFESKKIWTKLLICLLSIIVTLVGFTAVRSLKTPINSTVKFISQVTDSENENTIDRGYDMSNDISNRRFDVWKSGIEIYLNSTKNMLIGTSFCGFTDYAMENLPNTYIINNDYADMITVDNELLNILVSNGGLGLICVLIFVIYVIIILFKCFKFTDLKERIFFALMSAIIISLAAATMFASVMFFHFTPNAVIFWFVLGRFIAFLQVSKEKKLNESKN